MESNRIDVHSHLIPPFWAEELVSHGGDPSGWYPPVWSPEQLIGFMDDQSVAVSLLSLTAPGIDGWKIGEERTDIARRVNDYGVGLVNRYTGRFGYLATLALPDIESALKEVGRVYDELQADGVSLHSNYDGVYLSDSTFDPLWEELNRRSAVVFIHPTTPKGVNVIEGIPGPIEDYPAETKRCALDLAVAGHTSRFNSTKIILSHGGGVLPYAASRFSTLMSTLKPDLTGPELTSRLKSYYFDTALVAPSGLPSLLAFAPHGHVLFGTDYCYAPPAACVEFTQNLDRYEGFELGQLEEINRGAAGLFPRRAVV